MATVTRIRRPPLNLARVPAQLDGNIPIARLAYALATGGFTITPLRDGSLLIHEIPRYLITEGPPGSSGQAATTEGENR